MNTFAMLVDRVAREAEGGTPSLAAVARCSGIDYHQFYRRYYGQVTASPEQIETLKRLHLVMSEGGVWRKKSRAFATSR